MSKLTKSMQVIPIFFATDDAYAPFLAVSIRSLLANASDRYFYKIHILTSAMSQENRERIALLADSKSSISFDDASNRMAHIAGDLMLRDYYSIATYYRLFIADMFPEYDRAIYVDSDTVVTDDISKMFAYELGSNLVGAIHDNVMFVPILGDYVEKVVGVKREKYFNAGILLMNLKRFREVEMERRFVEILSKRPFPTAQDQDYLNLLCRENVLYLPYEWNLVPVEDFADRQPSIIHFKMAMRPWGYDGILFEEYFWKYAKDSGYYDDICEIKKNYSDADKQNDIDVGNGLIALAIEEIGRVERGELPMGSDVCEQIRAE